MSAVPANYPKDRVALMQALESQECTIIRECLFSLQGIPGEFTQWEEHNGAVTVSPTLVEGLPPDIDTTTMSGGARDALALCGQTGWLYQRILQFVQRHETNGSIVRALSRAVAHELEPYQEFVAALEVNCSLREIVVALYPQWARLKTLALVCNTHLQGPDILTSLHRHAIHHGDSRHVPLLQRILEAASQPWFRLLHAWFREGTLEGDPHGEFFVAAQPECPPSQLWSAGYRLHRDKVPQGMVDPDVVDLVFSVGKGVNYIRKCLQDGEWSLSILSQNNAPLRDTLERSQTLVQSHILERLRNQHTLVNHLFALKQFLLLGQGDFFSSLMDGIHAEYQHHKSVYGVYRHNLAAIVEGSLQSTNASSLEDDILERLQVELLLEKDHEAYYTFAAPSVDDAAEDGRTVWDIFLLEYTLPDPLVAIVSPESMKIYQHLFLFLFGLKKVEYLLDQMWRQSSILQRALYSNAQYLGIQSTGNKAYAQAIVLLRQVAMARQSMMHFVCNVKTYLMFEVLEGAWERLVPKLQTAESLDEIIQAHESYLNSIFRKTLLRTKDDEPANELELAGKLEPLLALASDFCTFQEELFGEALEAAERAAQNRREIERKAKQGSWGIEQSEERPCFGLSDSSNLEVLDSMTKEFNEQIFVLLQALDGKINGRSALDTERKEFLATPPSRTWSKDDDEQDDLDSLRSFASQLDYNKYYGVLNL